MERRVATAWWDVWTGAAACRWAGQDPGKGAVGHPDPPPLGLSHLVCRAAVVLQELKLVPDVGSEHCEG